MSNQKYIHIIQEVFDGLYMGGMIDRKIIIDDDTVILGAGTVLDSVAFVTLFMDLEDRLSEELGRDVFLLIDEIHDFNPLDDCLTVKVLQDYIVATLGECNE